MRALIADDSYFLRAWLRESLEQLGLECEEAEDGLHALNLLRSGECFDLMLVDVNMPRLNGLECVRQLREQEFDPAMKVIMVTTETDPAYVQQALAYGADEFLMKPFSVQSLSEKLLLLGFGVPA
jgi:two-component system chemotaxis response regulator CheY